MSKKKLKRLLNRLQEQIEMTDALNSALFDLKCLMVDEANRKFEALFPNVTIDPDTLICDLQKQGLNTTPLEKSAFDYPPKRPGVFSYDRKEPQPELKPGDVCEVVLNEGHFFEIGDYVEVIEIAKGMSRDIKCVNAKGPQIKIQFLKKNELKLKQ